MTLKKFLCVLFYSYILTGYTQKNNHTIAQICEFSFKGKITDFHDNTPIIGASLYIETLNIYTTTDLEGNFEFKNLCKDEYVIEIKHISCTTKRILINLNKNIFKEILLEHHLEELREVIVNANTKSETTSIEKSLKKEVITNFSDKSLGDALNTLSGISSLNTGNTIVKPMIHGLHSSRLLIINNDVRLFDQDWGDEHAPNIDINSSYRIDVVTGANTLRYGSDAIGGLILLKPKKYAFKDSLFGSTSLSLNSNGFGGNINSEIVKIYKSGYYGKIQTSFKKFGDFKAPNYYLTNTGIQNFNASTSFGFNSFEKGFNVFYSIVNNQIAILKSSHIGNVNDLVASINNREPRVIEEFSYKINNPKQSIVHHLGKIDAFKRYSSFGKLSLQYDFQINRRKEFDLRRGDLKNTPVINLSLFTNSLQSNLQIDYFENLKLNTGILVRYQRNNPISGTGVRPLIPGYHKYDAGIYSIANLDIDDSIEISGGLRYDFSHINANKIYNLTDWNETYNYDELFPEFEGTIKNTRIYTNPKFSYHNLSGSFGVIKKFQNNIQVLFNYGLASRVPNPSELFSEGLHHSAARIESGLLTIGQEIANKFSASLEFKEEENSFTITPYYNSINGYIQLIPIGITTTIRGAFPVWEYSQIDAEIFGVDIDLNKKITKQLNYSGNLSLLQGNNLTEKIPLIHMPSVNFMNGLYYNNAQFHQLNIGISYKSVLQQKRFPDYNFDTYNPITQENIYVDISGTPTSYSLLNFKSSINFNVSKNSTMNVQFNIDNVLNTSYREYLNRFRYYSDELGRNFNLKIRIDY